MFYLTTHSTQFIYGYMASGCVPKTLISMLLLEGNVLFNDALNTFYLRLYDVRVCSKNTCFYAAIGRQCFI